MCTEKKTISKRKHQSEFISIVKKAGRIQSNFPIVEIELSNNFKNIVVTKDNPAIKKAKQKKVPYTVAHGQDIVEVSGHKSCIVGKIGKSDVKLTKGTTYKFR